MRGAGLVPAGNHPARRRPHHSVQRTQGGPTLSALWSDELGAVAASVDYPLRPKHPYLKPLEDCTAHCSGWPRNPTSRVTHRR